MDYRLPERFDDAHILMTREVLELAGVTDDVVLDFSPVRFVLPFATLVFGWALIDLFADRSARGYKTYGKGFDESNGGSYLGYFGFFKTIGFQTGNEPDQAPGGSRYLPLTRIRLRNLERDAGQNPYQREIERQCDRLAAVLFPGADNLGAADMISFCLREIIRNCFEHGQITTCMAMAQRWANGDAEIAIGDRGMGIMRALSQRHRITSAEDAIRKALLPGISSGEGRRVGNKWDNSGFGLYILSELGRRYGNFSVITSGSYYRGNGSSDFHRLALTGTIVRLKVNTAESDHFPNILKQIVDEGEKRAKGIAGAIKSASKTSRVGSGWEW